MYLVLFSTSSLNCSMYLCLTSQHPLLRKSRHRLSSKLPKARFAIGFVFYSVVVLLHHRFIFLFSKYSLADQQGKIYLPSVSNAIMLASALGIIEAVALSTGSSFLMNTMGIPVVCLFWLHMLQCLDCLLFAKIYHKYFQINLSLYLH